MKAKLQVKLFGLFILCYFFNACGNSANRYIPNVSNIKTEAKIERFDRDFFAMDTANMPAAMQQLAKKYPDFAPIFVNDILGGKMFPDSIANTKAFLIYPYSRKLYDTTQIVYPNTEQLQTELQSMLRYYQYYFPNDSTPIRKLYTFVSIYKYGIIVMDDYIAVGLDFFLGENHADYMGVENLRHAYIRRSLTPAYLPAQIAYAIAEDIVETAAPRKGNKLIDYMLHNGKKLYLSQCFVPHTTDSLVYRFSEFQMQYCQTGEQGLYDHLSKEVNLYSDKEKDFRGYVNEGPFNPKTGTYGNSASWLGAQMVSQYADRIRAELNRQAKDRTAQATDGLVIQRILTETDPQEFLKRYKPRR